MKKIENPDTLKDAQETPDQEEVSDQLQEMVKAIESQDSAKKEAALELGLDESVGQDEIDKRYKWYEALSPSERRKIDEEKKTIAEAFEETLDVKEEGSDVTGESKDGIFREAVGKKIQGIMNESRLPSEDYESTVGVYGGKMNFDDEGSMVWDRRGIVSKIDKAGDAILRTYDEHVVKEPWKMLWRHPRAFLEKLFIPGTKRYRGSNEEILENVERLGLDEYYGAHENGIEIKKPEIYQHGVALQDVYRADVIDSDKLKEVNRFQALGEASKYISKIHQEHGAVGELLVSDIIFQEDEDGKLGRPVLNLPDIVFNKEKSTSEVDKKTTDLLDFLASVFGEEYRKDQNLEDVDMALETVLANYEDKNIISLVESFIKRGRLTLQGDTELLNLPESITKKARGAFAQHNKARLGSKKDLEGLMKEKILGACENFLNKE